MKTWACIVEALIFLICCRLFWFFTSQSPHLRKSFKITVTSFVCSEYGTSVLRVASAMQTLGFHFRCSWKVQNEILLQKQKFHLRNWESCVPGEKTKKFVQQCKLKFSVLELLKMRIYFTVLVFLPLCHLRFVCPPPDRPTTSEGLPKRKALRQFVSFQETNTCFGSKGSISISVLNQFFKLSIVFPAAARPTSEGLPHSKSSFLKTNGFLFRK